MLDIHGLMEGLAAKRPVFHSEADFQFALAWQIREVMGHYVRLEFPPFPKERMRLDIWVPALQTALELKYPTRDLELRTDDEVFALRNQGTPDLGQYDFLRDSERLEQVAGQRSQAAGIALLLTNEPLYWDSSSRSETADDVVFRLNERRRLPARMDWPDQRRAGKGKERQSPICLRGSYTCGWRDYGRRVAAGVGSLRFRYIAIHVLRNGSRRGL